ncbi:hypothetical protein C4585_00635 [Candidatus Parcubacteria bacterium]|nr:MAG: hypothetical protein C4585_00635 [Candidatus Parcubacteria bacterium]
MRLFYTYRRILALPALILCIPASANALTLVQVAELFNIFVGLMLTVGILIYVAGLGVYFSRLGTWPNHRDKAIKIMEWGIAVLFVLIVILIIVQHFQRYPVAASIVVAGLILLVVGVISIRVLQSGGEGGEEKKKGGH